MTMLCIRNLMVSQPRKKLSYKTLDASLVTYQHKADGTREVVSITNTCTQMDSTMPEMLGVPKAVLEHVVFCHQEESNWPLFEGTRLKERFDQIFESERYTKAMQEMKKVRSICNNVFTIN